MTVMAEPISEQCIVALMEVLSDLGGLRPGGWIYPQTPGIARTVAAPGADQMKSANLPHLYVVPSRGSRLEGVGISRTSRTYSYQYQVDIYGVVEGDAFTFSDTWRNRLREDVLTMLHLDLSLGGLAQNIIFSERVQEVDAGELAPKSWFLLPLTITLPETYATTL